MLIGTGLSAFSTAQAVSKSKKCYKGIIWGIIRNPQSDDLDDDVLSFDAAFVHFSAISYGLGIGGYRYGFFGSSSK